VPKPGYVVKMKTASLPLPRHNIINTEPLFLRYEVLAQAMLAMTLAGQFLKAGLAARKIVRLARVASKLEAHNVQLRNKLKMLSHKQWREKVLKDLGGLRKLIMWEAAKARIEARAALPKKESKRTGPAWLYTAERIAESERLKARKREIFRANQNPRIVRDRCKVDCEGDFRLAPLPRGERAPRQMKVYTENTIIEYDWNPMPFQEEKGFGPACVWPEEFYAAMKIEAEILEERTGEDALSTSLCSRNSQSEYPGSPAAITPNDREPLRGDPGSGVWFPNPGPGTQEEAKERKREETATPTISVYYVLPPKVLTDLFTPIPEEASHAGS